MEAAQKSVYIQESDATTKRKRLLKVILRVRAGINTPPKDCIKIWGIEKPEGIAYPTGKPIAQLDWPPTQLTIRVEPSVADDFHDDSDKTWLEAYGEKDRDEYPRTISITKFDFGNTLWDRERWTRTKT